MMKRVKMTAAACAMAMFALFTGAAAQDFNTNERTYLTFSGTVELPGTTLQPGTYLFRLADSQSNRHIVHVFNQDESQILATILAVPAERLEVTGENVVTFRETAEGGTPAVQYWYYPGDRIGHEFVYPREQAERIAKRTGQNVLTADGDVASADTTVSSVGPDGQVTEWERENAPAQTAESQAGTVEGTAGMSQQPAGEPQTAQASPETVNPAEESQNPESETPPAEPMTAQSQPAQPSEMTQPEPPAQPAPAEQAQAEQPEPEPQQPEGAAAVGTAGQEPAAAQQPAELPRTASPLPLSGLIGLFSLGGALALRRMRK